MIELICPKCKKKLDIPDEFAGQTGACVFCKCPIHVPIIKTAAILPPQATEQSIVIPEVTDYKPIPAPVFEVEPNEKKKVKGRPICLNCGGDMKKTTVTDSTGCAVGCLLVVVGIFISLTFWGAIIGIPCIIFGLLCGSSKVLKCRSCGSVIKRDGWF